MKKIKLKKIRFGKLFIFLGLIFTMFTAFIINFKSYAYTTNPDGDLVSNNLVDWTRIRQNDDSTWYITNTGYREQIGFGNFPSSSNNYSFNIRYNPLSQYNQDLYLNCIDNSLITPGEYVWIYQYNVSVDYYRFDITLQLLGEEFYIDNYYGLHDNYAFGYLEIDSSYSGPSHIMINHPIVNMPSGSVDFFVRFQLFKINSNDLGFNPFMYNGPKFYADDDPELNYSSGYNTGYNIGYNDGLNVNSDSFSEDYNSLAIQYSELQSDYETATNRITSLENANRVLSQQLANAQNGYNLNSLMWSIGGTPFESFKQIWNVNFMGVNIANLFLGLITALVFIWILKHFLL